MRDRLFDVFNSFGPIALGNIIALVVFLITLSYTIGNVEAKTDARYAQLSQTEMAHYASVLATATSDKTEAAIRLKSVEDRLAKAEQLEATLNKMAAELSGIHAEQQATVARINDLRQDIHEKK